jgi:rhodanese-related sulfurtransferase
MASKSKARQRRPANIRRNPQVAARQARQRTIIGAVLASLTVLAVIVIVVLTQHGDTPDDVAGVSPRQAYDLMNTHHGDAAWVTLDVRTPTEFSAGHLADATNLDFNASGFRAQASALDHARTYIVYCHTGNRSGQATAIMHDLGFTHLYDIKGGIAAWQQAGLPTTG